MRAFIAFLTGGLFGTGLLVSDMINARKVQGWLDVFGDWDPTLTFVMGGAIIPMAIAWQLTRKRTPVLGGTFPERPDPRLGRNLIIGSVMFGMGWGLTGLCPGPAMASLGFGGTQGILFMTAMALGMWIAPTTRNRLDALGAKG